MLFQIVFLDFYLHTHYIDTNMKEKPGIRQESRFCIFAN